MRKRTDASYYTTCDKCGTRYHYSSDNCTGAFCLADYWDRQAERAEAQAREHRQTAKNLREYGEKHSEPKPVKGLR